MIKKIALLTLYGNYNYGNKLQNYAVQEILKRYIEDGEIITIRNYQKTNIGTLIKAGIDYFGKECKKKGIFYAFLQFVKKILNILIGLINRSNSKGDKDPFYEKQLTNRNNNFVRFDKNIKTSDFVIDATRPDTKLLQGFNYYVVGSDQVWNPGINIISSLFTLGYIKDNSKKIAFSASFAVDYLPKGNQKRMKEISKFKAISVREIRGKEIIEECTDRNNAQVLLDPTMLMSTESRDKVSICPSQFKELGFINNKYIFCYFLGSVEEIIKLEIERVAKENYCKIIYIMDKNDPFFTSGPSEFIWLIKNAYLICTDSFHGSAFSLLYNKPFVVFNRIDPGQKKGEKNSMNSRIITLLEKFGVNNRYFNGRIDDELLIPNYPQFDNVLRQETRKADEFLKYAFSE